MPDKQTAYKSPFFLFLMDKSKTLIYLFLRYLFLIIIALPGFAIFYFIFSPLTIYPSYWILSLFYQVSLQGNSFIIDNYSINIIEACVAGGAYYLLLILNLSTPMKVNVRVKSLLFLLSTFLLFNISRLVIFSSLALEGFSYFDIAHKYTWYFGSTIFVALLWFLNVYIFKISEIPIFSDFKMIYSQIKLDRKIK